MNKPIDSIPEDEYLLGAYADGELDAEHGRALEATLFSRPDMMRRLQEIRAQNALLRAAYPLPPAATLALQPRTPGSDPEEPAGIDRHAPLAPARSPPPSGSIESAQKVHPIRSQAQSEAPVASDTAPAPRQRFSLAACIALLACGALSGALASHALWSKAPAMTGDAEAHFESALQFSLENAVSGSSSDWSTGDQHGYGQIIPVSTYQNEHRQYCREFEEERVVNGVRRRSGGVACREDDGQWRLRIRYYP
ncbi:MAG: hypothetical protein KDK91_29630 [Gammaproteobacteria bacterium]|nr:hypothetical protein [Gammaproteobacteria bacterium]